MNWEPPSGTSLEDHAATLLDPVAYQTEYGYDALNRITWKRYPEDVEGAEARNTEALVQPGGALGGILEGIVAKDYKKAKLVSSIVQRGSRNMRYHLFLWL